MNLPKKHPTVEIVTEFYILKELLGVKADCDQPLKDEISKKNHSWYRNGGETRRLNSFMPQR